MIAVRNLPPRRLARLDRASAVRVLIADDHALFRDGLSRLVAREPDLEVVGQASDGLEAIELTRNLVPDVILMDVNMPGIGGIEATQRIHAELPQIRIIGLSMHTDHEHVQAMWKAGAVDYKTKACPASELLQAIRNCVKEAGRIRRLKICPAFPRKSEKTLSAHWAILCRKP